ncbi:MAG: hypothetical protein HYZ75_10055 [Elusimicrobia bacterium]|nr:hypothetical protein [Elusimicrobiota bacterium]
MKAAAAAALSIQLAVPVGVDRVAAVAGEPDAVVDLGAVFNKNWKAETHDTPGGPVALGTQFDAEGNTYLAVMAPHAMVATHYRYEAGMKGSWQAGGETYDLSLDVSIFRARTNNLVVIKRRSDGREVYRRKIRDVLLSTYPLGTAVTIAGREYRVFFGNGVLKGEPARADPASRTLCLVTDTGGGGEPDFRSYIIPFRALEGGGLTTYKLYDGARVKLRARVDAAELELYFP